MITPQIPDPIPAAEMPLLVLVHGIVGRQVAGARREYGAPLPGLHGAEFADAPESVQVAALLAPAVAWLLNDPFRETTRGSA